MNIKELSLNNYNDKSKSFALTVLKHYPMQKEGELFQQHYKPYMHMHDHRKERQIFERSTKQKLQNMETFKSQGNQYFCQKKYEQAAYYYNKMIVHADYTFPDTQEQQSQMDTLVQLANINLALSLIKLQKWETTHPTNLQVLLNEAIKGPKEKQQLKAYYWMTRYFVTKGQFQKSRESLKLLIQKNQNVNDSSDKTSLQTIKQLKLLIQKESINYQNQSKGIFGQIFSK